MQSARKNISHIISDSYDYLSVGANCATRTPGLWRNLRHAGEVCHEISLVRPHIILNKSHKNISLSNFCHVRMDFVSVGTSLAVP
jgi:hypothetical protein